MRLPYELFISLRYLKFRRKEKLLSAVSLIAIFGIAIGVTALLITLSVMNGFHSTMQEKILSMSPDVLVLDRFRRGIVDFQTVQQKISQIPGVVDTAPFVYNQILLRVGDVTQGGVVKGILPEEECKIANFGASIYRGNLEELNPDNGGCGIVLGRGLAQNLGVNLGDEVALISPLGMRTPVGILPRLENFKLVGIFDSGMYEYDTGLAYISLSRAQELFNLKDAATGISIKITNIYKAGEIAGEIQKELKFPYEVQSWQSINRNLFSALKLEKITMFIILTLIVLVAGFNIIGMLIMLTITKVRAIGILRAMGASQKGIARIFISAGGLIGLIGTSLGVVGAYIINRLLATYQFIKLPAEVYYLSYLPVKMEAKDFLVVCAGAIIISLLATIYPAYRAAKLEPTQAIRYE